jgi:hypothetical protein
METEATHLISEKKSFEVKFNTEKENLQNYKSIPLLQLKDSFLFVTKILFLK